MRGYESIYKGGEHRVKISCRTMTRDGAPQSSFLSYGMNSDKKIWIRVSGEESKSIQTITRDLADE